MRPKNYTITQTDGHEHEVYVTPDIAAMIAAQDNVAEVWDDELGGQVVPIQPGENLHEARGTKGTTRR